MTSRTRKRQGWTRKCSVPACPLLALFVLSCSWWFFSLFLPILTMLLPVLAYPRYFQLIQWLPSITHIVFLISIMIFALVTLVYWHLLQHICVFFFLLLFIVLIIVILEQLYSAMTVNIYLIKLYTRWIIFIFRFVGTQIKEEKDGQGHITKDREGQDLPVRSLD